MELSEIMTKIPVSVRPEERVDLAARLLRRGNVGALPVCGDDGIPIGVVTDRDVVTRCVALGQKPEDTPVSEIMTRNVVSISETASAEEAAALMGKYQIRRLPVTAGGELTGIVSLGDLVRNRQTGAANALGQVSENISRR